VGLSATGRSLQDPATARKAEKKKRGEGARALTNGDASAGNLLDDGCAVLRHGVFYTICRKKGQGYIKEKANAQDLCVYRACPTQYRRGIERVYFSMYTGCMTRIAIGDAKNRLTELARRVEEGERFTVTRNGKPVMELVPAETAIDREAAPQNVGINWEGLKAFKREHGITDLVTYVAPDFDDPLPEDFLITPLPPSVKSR
jgi:prevent-host-death family protein